jgi:hypothetical protein
MYGDFPAKITVCTPYIPINVRFWPTLLINIICTRVIKVWKTSFETSVAAKHKRTALHSTCSIIEPEASGLFLLTLLGALFNRASMGENGC